MSEHQFYEAFNQNAISATVARVQVTDSGIITMGNLEWWAEGVDWYLIEIEEKDGNSDYFTIGELVDELQPRERSLPAFSCIANEDGKQELAISPISELVEVRFNASVYSSTGFTGNVENEIDGQEALVFYCNA